MKKVLFVQSSLGLGGIETFFVRLVKELSAKGVRPQFVFLYKKLINPKLLIELQKYSDVYYWQDLVGLSVDALGEKAKLMLPLSSQKVEALFSDCEAIHVSNALTYLCAQRLASCLPQNLKCVFGIYHANELAWGGKKIPAYEGYFREKLFGTPPMLLFFNQASVDKTAKSNNFSHYPSRLFPLGVDMPTVCRGSIETAGDKLRLISVGRLVEFKTYNLYMLDVARDLKDNGINFTYSIFGSGPLSDVMAARIAELGLQENVILEGDLEYSRLDEELSTHHLFIGTGTALLHAAANGLACITAIENEPDSNSYGYFSELPGYDYHEQGMNFEKYKFYDLIAQYSLLNLPDREVLSQRHLVRSKAFDMNACADNFVEAFETAPFIKKSSFIFYSFMLRFVACELIATVTSGEKYSKKYEHVL
ncbi:glycosyltransferase [Pseudomonas rhodesiae]|uniref:glycosyltransferase n=1 Tax=Pseudomonas rhodesiae TaxID=76760 RepID=UPI002898CFC0|nr:glycosyltransferase [Pseudomonas rhodesiae]